MSKLIYSPLKKSYNEDINDLVEETMTKGGVGSGKRGHKTANIIQNMPGHLMAFTTGEKDAHAYAKKDGKAKVYHHAPTNTHHVVTDGVGRKHFGSHPEFTESVKK